MRLGVGWLVGTGRPRPPPTTMDIGAKPPEYALDPPSAARRNRPTTKVAG